MTTECDGDYKQCIAGEWPANTSNQSQTHDCVWLVSTDTSAVLA